MNPLGVFALQFLWFLVAWTAIAILFIVPRLRDADPDTALSVWIAPHIFRVLGLGLLVPALSPGMPTAFAIPTAVGDTATALLALLSLLALRARWRHARVLVWIFSVFGSADLVLALVQAARLEAASHLAGQWYVATLGVPLMLVTHGMVLRTLLTRRPVGAT